MRASMKLLDRYSRINVGATIAIFLVAALALFVSLHYILLQQIDDDLRIEEREILLYVQKNGRIPESSSVDDQLIEFHAADGNDQRRFQTLDLVDPTHGDKEKFRQLRFTVRDTQGWHLVLVSKALEQTDALVTTLFFITTVTILFILLLSFAINRWAVKRLWRPFYAVLDSVRHYKLNDGAPLRLPSTTVEEFQFMNERIEAFAGQARLDFLALKTFSENATHELQTPIAVVRSKLDLLQQEPGLGAQGAAALQGAYDSLQRLDRLNASLLLLARIENRQFADTEPVDVNELLRAKLREFQELLQEKEIQVEHSGDTVIIRINPALCQILLNNLLSNALRYTATGGTLQLNLDKASLSVCNTADGPALDEQTLYQRFQRGNGNRGSAGLGLALIKQICDVSGFRLSYRHSGNRHCFRVSWPA
ncbi:HAMP domain-containing histidine kinase [Flaviaesturariibacter aridisoli]|uniref:histidine kinase n=2 Tax=Flaviaesturariibacter aridisoli TaxID=2545761 RepID=A0A4R4DXF9_9BACT|nr:HAMP domain-containing histidine kinase [Flaviaesturariibacter aridisoli]